MKWSALGARYSEPVGMLDLMSDLGHALAGNGELAMLGGGNPARIPALETRFEARLAELLEQRGSLERMVGRYSPPEGDLGFRSALAGLLTERCGIPVGAEHIVLTNGSQAAFYMLFNALAGPGTDGRTRHVLLPMLPEYIGYADLALAPHALRGVAPRIELEGGDRFKYHIDFDAIEIDEDTAALCLSRPGNPTANLAGHDELERLHQLAVAADIPLIIDGAYGLPFPHIVFGADARPFWGSHVVLCLSLSKLGLPGVRTGIVVAPPAIAAMLTRMNAVMTLAPASVGPVLVQRWIETGEILELARSAIQPYYRERVQHALALLPEALAGVPYRVHRPEGGLFLWLWFPGLPIPATALYAKLKAAGVLVVPGSHFFPGYDATRQGVWPHREECLRVTYAQPPEVVERGLRLLGEVLRSLPFTAVDERDAVTRGR